MSGYERRQSPIFVKTHDFIVWLFTHTSRFPRQYRHTLTERLENGMLQFQRCLGSALILKDENALAMADFELWNVRQLLRLAHDVKALSARLLEFAFKGLEEIGRLLGGWQKKNRKKGDSGVNSPRIGCCAAAVGTTTPGTVA